MAYHAVTREHGPAWNAALPMREQDAWDEHAAFMEELADDGFVVLGGPVGDGTRTLLIVDAEDEAEITRRFDSDPWTPMRLLRIATIERWQVLLSASTRGLPSP